MEITVGSSIHNSPIARYVDRSPLVSSGKYLIYVAGIVTNWGESVLVVDHGVVQPEVCIGIGDASVLVFKSSLHECHNAVRARHCRILVHKARHAVLEIHGLSCEWAISDLDTLSIVLQEVLSVLHC